jgi:hypothetical protein
VARVDQGAGVNDGDVDGVLNSIVQQVDIGAAAVVLVFLLWLEADGGIGEGAEEGLVQEVADLVMAVGADSSIQVAGGFVGRVLDEVDGAVAWTDDLWAAVGVLEGAEEAVAEELLVLLIGEAMRSSGVACSLDAATCTLRSGTEEAGSMTAALGISCKASV